MPTRETLDTVQRIVHAYFVRDYMDAGGCLGEFYTAMRQCDRDAPARLEHEIFDDKKTTADQVVPVSVESCIKATKTLRRCMKGNKDVFRGFIVAMDRGIEEDERRRREPHVEVENNDDFRFRWWTGMRNS